MDKLFHVFVSSTYSDLREERGRVSEALSKAGHVPEGMEIFPASSQKQLDFIKRVIDRCDYYVLILAGRYGSTIPTGESFTELEYQYALQKGIPTLAFLHLDVSHIELSKSEPDPDKARRLKAFRLRAEDGGLVDYWTAPDQLATKVVAAIAQEVSSNPGIGWIRGDRAASEQLLNEVNELRKANEDLQSSLKDSNPPIVISNLAKMDEQFTIHYKSSVSGGYIPTEKTINLSWREILKIVGPGLRALSNTARVEKSLEQYFTDVLKKDLYSLSFSMADKEIILNQLELLGFARSAVYNLKDGGQAIFYQLTPNGVTETIRLNAVRSGLAAS